MKSTTVKSLIIATAFIGLVISILGTNDEANASSGSGSGGQIRIDWYDLCTNPLVDTLIKEDCSSLVTAGGYELSPKGQHVLGCIGGGTLAVLTGNPELLMLGSSVGCGSNSGTSNANVDPISSLLSGILG